MKREIIRPVLSVWLQISLCLVIYFPHTLLPPMAPPGDDLGGRDSHHHRLHSGGLHHAGLRWSLLHRREPKHSRPARLPGQQQLHGLPERCECGLTSVPAEDWKYYPTLLGQRYPLPIAEHVLLIENHPSHSYRFSCCRVFEGEAFTWEAALCGAYAFTDSSGNPFDGANIHKKQMHLLMFLSEMQSELSFHRYIHIFEAF